MLITNPEELNQMRCHINTAVFLETAVFGQENWVFPLRKRGFRIVHGPDVFYVPSVFATV
jgi:hypothetical protein